MYRIFLVLIFLMGFGVSAGHSFSPQEELDLISTGEAFAYAGVVIAVTGIFVFSFMRLVNSIYAFTSGLYFGTFISIVTNLIRWNTTFLLISLLAWPLIHYIHRVQDSKKRGRDMAQVYLMAENLQRRLSREQNDGKN